MLKAAAHAILRCLLVALYFITVKLAAFSEPMVRQPPGANVRPSSLYGDILR